MGWKDWSSWLKGGVVGIIVFVISILVSLILSYLHSFFYNNGINSVSLIIELFQIFLGIVVIYPVLLISEITNLNQYLIGSGEPLPGLSIIGGLTGLLIYFIIGAIIGWIVGKIRSR